MKQLVQYLDEIQYPLETWAKGLDLPPTDVLRHGNYRVDWSVFAELLRRFEAIAGTETLEKLGHLASNIKETRSAIRIMGFFTDVKTPYWLIHRWFGKSVIGNIDSEFEQISEHRIVITLKLQDGYEASPQAFKIFRGNLTTIPRSLGLRDSVVNVEYAERFAVYDIVLPSSMSIWARFRRAFHALSGGASAIEALARQDREIQESHRELQEKNRIVKESAKMASLGRLAAVGEMAGGIAHEINNPLMIIQGKAHQLKKLVDAGKTPPEEVGQIADKILDTVERISKITGSLLRIGRGGESSERSDVAVQKILEDTIELGRERYRKLDIQVSVAGVPLDWSVTCNAVQISQVLLNLLNNAVDAVKDERQREIVVRVSNDMSGFYLFSVDDSGPGVSAHAHGKIFDPFFTTKSVGKGTGLGLSISKTIIEEHGGRLWLDENSSGWTRFSFTLPRSGDTGDGKSRSGFRF